MSRGVPIDQVAKNSPIHRAILDVVRLFQKAEDVPAAQKSVKKAKLATFF